MFAPDKYKVSAAKTIDALETLATALEDGNLSKDEIAANIDAISTCIAVWKEVK